MKKENNYFKSFWIFLQKDTWTSFVVTLGLAFILIKFIFFPMLSLLTGTTLPLVIVESCSMYHYEDGFEEIFKSPIYEDNGISIEDTSDWAFKDGFAKGDVIFVVEAKNIEIGDVIIFNAGQQHPLIHRVVETENNYATKGDNYKTNFRQLNSEKNIVEDQFVGKALFRVPFIGWAKLIFFEYGRAPQNRGLCR